jgi:two-component system, OmpR family, sensor histidine kinase ChvG
VNRWWARAWPPSRIGVRLLGFNLLVVFVPVLGVLYLDVYEDRLLQAQEREMVQQGRLIAAAVSGPGMSLDAELFTGILTRLDRQNEARFRLYDAQGVLIGDSARLYQAERIPPNPEYGGSPAASTPDVRRRVLYRLGAWIVKVRQRAGATARFVLRWKDLQPTQSAAGGADLAPQVRAALRGQYGAATTVTPGQRSLTLYSAVPVRGASGAIGAVVVSQSTFRVLQAIYEVRLRIFEVVMASILAAALMTTLAAMTIVRPLRRLRRQAASLAERRGPLPPSFPGATRKDELGDLARALEELTRRVNEHIGGLEGFAADVSHEFKNPLASIRTAAEMMGEAERPEDRDRFLGLMLRDVDRLERLVSGVREMARIDGELEQEEFERVDLGEMLHHAIEGVRLGDSTRKIELKSSDAAAVTVRASRERLAQVFDNILSNAVTFSPAGIPVEVVVTADGGACAVTVSDRGPGIPDAHLERVFDRFFTYRPVSGRGDHVGLGLAIAKRIVEEYGGTLSARNREAGGAVFTVRLPVLERVPRRAARAPEQDHLVRSS